MAFTIPQGLRASSVVSASCYRLNHFGTSRLQGDFIGGRGLLPWVRPVYLTASATPRRYGAAGAAGGTSYLAAAVNFYQRWFHSFLTWYSVVLRMREIWKYVLPSPFN